MDDRGPPAGARRGLGFRMRELMQGTHRLRRVEGELPAGTEQPFEFEVSWGHQCLTCFLNPLSHDFMTAEMTGLVSAGGLCQRAPLRGTLELRYVPDAAVRYKFEFAEGERRFRFEGEKRGIRPWNLHRTHTVCYGEVRDSSTGEIVSDAVVRFDLRQLPAFLSSFRLR